MPAKHAASKVAGMAVAVVVVVMVVLTVLFIGVEEGESQVPQSQWWYF